MNEYVKNLNRMEFVVTMACTGRCRHCSEGDHSFCAEPIDADAAVRAIYEVCGQYQIESLMAFGGEPLLYPEVVCSIFRAAAKMCIPKIDLITNGFFSGEKSRIRETVRMLADSGVRNILLSVDAFHQETIPLEPVKVFAGCVKEAGVPLRLSPAWLVSEEDKNPYNVKTREVIREFEDLNITVGPGNIVFPSGNALKYLGEYFEENTEQYNPYEENPADIRAISFLPNGDVLNGNIYQKSVLDILKDYDGFTSGHHGGEGNRISS